MTRLFPEAENTGAAVSRLRCFYAVQIFGWPHVGQKRVFASRVAPQVGQTQLVGRGPRNRANRSSGRTHIVVNGRAAGLQIVAAALVLPVQRVRRSWEQKRSDGSSLLPQDAQVRAGAEGRA